MNNLKLFLNQLYNSSNAASLSIVKEPATLGTLYYGLIIGSDCGTVSCCVLIDVSFR